MPGNENLMLASEAAQVLGPDDSPAASFVNAMHLNGEDYAWWETASSTSPAQGVSNVNVTIRVRMPNDGITRNWGFAYSVDGSLDSAAADQMLFDTPGNGGVGVYENTHTFNIAGAGTWTPSMLENLKIRVANWLTSDLYIVEISVAVQDPYVCSPTPSPTPNPAACATYGYSSMDAGFPLGSARMATLVHLDDPGDLQSLGVLVTGIGAQNGLGLALYDNSISSTPGTLLYDAGVQTAVAGWNSFPAALAGLPSGDYWIGIEAEDDVVVGFRFTGVNLSVSVGWPVGPFPDPWPNGSASFLSVNVVMEVCPPGAGASPTPSATETPVPSTDTPTSTLTPSRTDTVTSSNTPTPTLTSGAGSSTNTRTATPSSTATPTSTAGSGSSTNTRTTTGTLTYTPTPTDTGTVTRTRTFTGTPSKSPTATATATSTVGTATTTPSMTASPTPSSTTTLGTPAVPTLVPVPYVASGATSIYPSPATGALVHIAFNMFQAGQANIVVLDSAGHVVLTVTEDLGAGPAAVAVDISLLTRGIYFYRVALTFSDGTDQRLAGGRFAVLH
jgi:hypothetical protein